MAILLLAATVVAEDWPMPKWTRAQPADVGMDVKLLEQARDYALAGGGSGLVVRHGKGIFQWGDPKRRYDLKSTTKSIGSAALGLAVADGKIRLTDKAGTHHPSLKASESRGIEAGAADRITIFHLATQTAGYDKPGGTDKLLFEPGTKWSYSDSGPNWLAECITLVYRQDLKQVMFGRVFGPLGIEPGDLTWRRNAYCPAKIDGIARREFGSGISANVDAMARIGLLYLRGGRWCDKRIIPAGFVAAARATPKAVRGLPVVREEAYPAASSHYGLLWWNNADGALSNVPHDAFWSWGLHDSLIVVVPSLDLVVARAGRSFEGEWSGGYDRLAPFLDPIVASLEARPPGTRPAAGSARDGNAPYPPSPVIAKLRWAPTKSIVRKAKGSDNWPITWARDGHLYTAYGDGWGFEPKVKGKLSLGVCRVEGGPAGFKGFNIRTPTGEQKGDGRSGKKASGMLSVDGVLYMFVRNAKNSQLAWSADSGRSWQWSRWRFATSFGAATLLNFGRDYAGARDDFVYVYSFDSDSAYEPADRMVLARVPRAEIRQRKAYEFFVKLDDAGRCVWSRDIHRRGSVFEHKARCYRSGVSYCAALKRYLWVQVIPGGDTRFKGGLGIYDAPEPWGPWTTVFFSEKWEVGPGESARFPTKWMSADGKRLHLVFSGDDCFSVRRAALTLAKKDGP